MKTDVNLFEETNWENAENYSKGTLKKVLRKGEKGETILLKLPAGFTMAPHSHVITEQHLVIKGEYHSKNKSYPVGSYQIFRSGEEHGPFESKDGALILVIWDSFKSA